MAHNGFSLALQPLQFYGGFLNTTHDGPQTQGGGEPDPTKGRVVGLDGYSSVKMVAGQGDVPGGDAWMPMRQLYQTHRL